MHFASAWSTSWGSGRGWRRSIGSSRSRAPHGAGPGTGKAVAGPWRACLRTALVHEHDVREVRPASGYVNPQDVADLLEHGAIDDFLARKRARRWQRRRPDDR